jgi:hypothetical protein
MSRPLRSTHADEEDTDSFWPARPDRGTGPASFGAKGQALVRPKLASPAAMGKILNRQGAKDSKGRQRWVLCAPRGGPRSTSLPRPAGDISCSQLLPLLPLAFPLLFLLSALSFQL